MTRTTLTGLVVTWLGQVSGSFRQGCLEVSAVFGECFGDLAETRALLCRHAFGAVHLRVSARVSANLPKRVRSYVGMHLVRDIYAFRLVFRRAVPKRERGAQRCILCVRCLLFRECFGDRVRRNASVTIQRCFLRVRCLLFRRAFRRAFRAPFQSASVAHNHAFCACGAYCFGPCLNPG